MYICFDMEFTGLHKNTTPISIGLIDEYGKTFYAEFNDYDKSQCEENEFLQNEVIGNLKFNDCESYFSETDSDTEIKGSKEVIRNKLLKWLLSYKTVQFVSDVCHYDFVLLIDLLCGNALELPKNMYPVCRDINFDIAMYFNKSDIEAFDKNREEILTDYFEINNMPTLEKHNSLFDAKVIRMIFEKIRMY